MLFIELRATFPLFISVKDFNVVIAYTSHLHLLILLLYGSVVGDFRIN